ncbi:MAG: hypothetical protein ABSH47_21865 [Bryobacteraceae bacterium]|jgi:hypothetical protein
MFPALCLAQEPAPADEIAKLREQIATQQKQLNEQRQLLDGQQKALDAQQKALDRLLAAQVPVAPAAAAPSDIHGRPFSPLSFHIGGADFAPGGFLDFATVWRSTNVGTGTVTSFGTIPFSNTSAGRLMETRSSAQNSRLTLTVTGNPTKNLSVTGYVEADFWGSQPANGYVTSNSDTLRLRQFWVDLQRGKWEVLGGQAWTLLTPNRTGVSSVPADLFIGLGEDSNYQVGLTWARAGQLRVVYHPDNKWALAVSLESPEQYVTAATTLPSCAGSQIGNGTATSTPNVRPDIVAKIAYDTNVSNRALHFELAGLSRQFETSPAPGVHMSGQGLGGSFNTVMELAKNFRLILTSFYSSGGGRYAAGLGPDLVVGPDGSISPVHSMSGIAGFEYRPTAKSQIFAYYGADYFRRNYVVLGPGSYLGFGFPGSPTSANRQIQESTFGYIRTFWKNPNYGAVQIISQYSWLTRAPWSVPAGTPASAHVHMVFGSLRFTLP